MGGVSTSDNNRLCLLEVIMFAEPNCIGADMTNELDSMCGISDEELTERFKEAIRLDNEERRIKGEPIAKYDNKLRRAYLEFPDGRRQYAN